MRENEERRFSPGLIRENGNILFLLGLFMEVLRDKPGPLALARLDLYRAGAKWLKRNRKRMDPALVERAASLHQDLF